MIEFRKGDIFQSDARALVNPVNCVGVMGKGLALQFKQKFPANFQAYAAACKQGQVQPSRMHVHEEDGKTIVNFPTKRHWRDPSRLPDVEAGIRDLALVIRERGIESIAIPALGSGLGGLDWRRVRPLLERELAGLEEVQVTVYEPW